MKKIMLVLVFLTFLLVFEQSSTVNAAIGYPEFTVMKSGRTRNTPQYSTTANSTFWVILWMFENSTPLNCYMTPTSKVTVTSRSMAGATGSTIELTYLNQIEHGYNSFYYGDEDV